jgi:hypothetical protein
MSNTLSKYSDFAWDSEEMDKYWERYDRRKAIIEKRMKQVEEIDLKRQERLKKLSEDKILKKEETIKKAKEDINALTLLYNGDEEEREIFWSLVNFEAFFKAKVEYELERGRSIKKEYNLAYLVAKPVQIYERDLIYRTISLKSRWENALTIDKECINEAYSTGGDARDFDDLANRTLIKEGFIRDLATLDKSGVDINAFLKLWKTDPNKLKKMAQSIVF